MIKSKLRKSITYILGGTLAAFAVFLILAATRNNSSKRCKGLETKIKDNSEQFLVTKDDIEKWLTQYGHDPFEGKIIENISLEKVEKRIEEGGMVKNCKAYFDLQGYLVLEIEAYKPIGRILSNIQNQDRFIDAEGNIFPISKHFSPTVLLLSGPYVDRVKNLKSKKNADLLSLINTIYEDDFWSSQITQMVINEQQEVSMIPLMSNITIEFGKPVNVNTKFEKLLIFYKQILPQKALGDFSKISVKYKGQIVCN